MSIVAPPAVPGGTPGRDRPRPLTVFATVALQNVLSDLEPMILRRTGRAISPTFGPGQAMLQALQSGVEFDVGIARRQDVERAVSEGHLGGEIVEVAESILGLAVHADVPLPSIQSVDDLVRALRDCPRVAYTDPASGAVSGVWLDAFIESNGIAEEVRAKAVLGRGDAVATHVRDGTAQLAIQQLSELLLVDGIRVAALPKDCQVRTALVGAVHVRSDLYDAAWSVLMLMRTSPGRGVLAARGLQPTSAWSRARARDRRTRR